MSDTKRSGVPTSIPKGQVDLGITMGVKGVGGDTNKCNQVVEKGLRHFWMFAPNHWLLN